MSVSSVVGMQIWDTDGAQSWLLKDLDIHQNGSHILPKFMVQLKKKLYKKNNQKISFTQ